MLPQVAADPRTEEPPPMDHARTTTPSTSFDTPTPRPAWTTAEILALLA